MKHLIPFEIYDQHLFVGGKTGAGKSSVLRWIVEQLLDQGKRVCIIDPKGDWWGIKSSADGKKAGYPLVIFGDQKVHLSDSIPINARVGREVAELVASGNRPCVIGFRGWMPGDRTKFWIDFASTIFNKNTAPLVLVIDEFHNFAMQGKVLDPEAGKCLHWSNRILTEGRGSGIRVMMSSQRPQKVHKDSLTCAETLIAMRVIHKLDRDAFKDWIDGAGDQERGKMVLNSLAEMARGEAFVWYPEGKFFERVKFPKFRTFDSFKSPTGDEKQHEPKGWADIDLGEVKDRLAGAIEEAKANDPKELRQQLARTKKDLDVALRTKDAPTASLSETKEAQKEAHKYRTLLEGAMKILAEITTRNFDSTVPKEQIEAAIKSAVDNAVKRVEGAIEGRKKEFEGFKKNIHAALRRMQAQLDTDIQVKVDVKHNEPHTVTVSPRTQQTAVVPLSGELTNPEQRIIDAIAWMESIGTTEPEQPAVAFLAGYRYGGGAYNNPRGSLRSKGLVEYRGNKIALTDSGRQLANQQEHSLTTEELQKRVMDRLPTPEQRVLAPLLKAYPDTMTNESLAEASGYVVNTGGYNNPRGRLRTLGLIEYQSGSVVAKSLLFLE